MIDQITINKIQDAAQIVDVVSDYVTLRKRGVNYVGLCPFHDDRTPSFYVSPSKNICKCFACGEGGSPIHFIMKHEQLSYVDALKHLAKKYHIEVVEKELTNEEKEEQSLRDSLFILNDFAANYFEKNLHEDAEGRSVGLAYFRERGFRDDIVKKFRLGYSLEERDVFSREAQKAGFKETFLEKTGLSVINEQRGMIDRFRGRVMFPIHTLSGKVVAFGGRILKKAENTGKYINSPESEIYSKSNELYGIYFAKNAIVKADKCFLVEGYTDVISMHQAGIENVVASSGTALTHGQIRMIHRFTENITVLYDGDAAGIKAALRGIDLLLEDGMNVKVVLLPQGEDPDSFAKKQNAEDFTKYIAAHETDFIRFKTQLLLNEIGDDPLKRATLIKDIVDSIAIIPNNINRAVYIQDCANILDVNETVLMREVNKIRLKNYDKQKDAEADESDKNIQRAEDAPTVAKSASSDINFGKFEKEIIRYIIRYGMTPLYVRYTSKKVTENGITEDVKEVSEIGPSVLKVIRFDLERDNILFTKDIYRIIYDEAVTQMQDENFNPSRYFISHPNSEISKIASDMMSDRYQLSKIHAKSIGNGLDDKNSRLVEENLLESLVPKATTELKNRHVLHQINEVKKQMKTADASEIETLLKQLNDLQQLKKEISKLLGERIILRF